MNRNARADVRTPDCPPPSIDFCRGNSRPGTWGEVMMILFSLVFVVNRPLVVLRLSLWSISLGASSLGSNTTYLLKNLKVKTNKHDRYLNTAKDEKFIFQEVNPFEAPLAEVDPTTETPTITGKIIGVQQITNTMACITCYKNVVPCPEGATLGECQGYKLLQVHVHHIGVSELQYKAQLIHPKSVV